MVDFAIKLTASGVGKVRLANQMRLFDPRDVAFQLFVRNAEVLFLFCAILLHIYSPFPALV